MLQSVRASKCIQSTIKLHCSVCARTGSKCIQSTIKLHCSERTVAGAYGSRCIHSTVNSQAFTQRSTVKLHSRAFTLNCQQSRCIHFHAQQSTVKVHLRAFTLNSQQSRCIHTRRSTVKVHSHSTVNSQTASLRVRGSRCIHTRQSVNCQLFNSCGWPIARSRSFSH